MSDELAARAYIDRHDPHHDHTPILQALGLAPYWGNTRTRQGRRVVDPQPVLRTPGATT